MNIRPIRPRDKTMWSLPEGLAKGAVYGPDHAWPMRGDHIISTGRRYIRLSPLLNKGI